MMFPLYPLDAFGYEGSLVLGTLIGFGFGFVLERSGFGRAPVQLAVLCRHAGVEGDVQRHRHPRCSA